MSGALTQSQIDILSGHAAAGDRVAYYKALSSFGYAYGELALGVVLNDTFTGQAANAFQAEWGAVGGHLNALIGYQLMDADLDARGASSNFAYHGDLKVDVVRDYHSFVYERAGLSKEAWTAYAPTYVAERLAWYEAIQLGFDEGTALEMAEAAGEAQWAAFLQGGTQVAWAYESVLATGDLDLIRLAADWIGTINGLAIDFALSLFDYEFNVPYTYQAPAGPSLVGGTDHDDADIAGTAAADAMIGYDGKDTLSGGAGDDRLYGCQDDDVLIGGAGRDYLHGGARIDAPGEEGFDTADYSGAAAGIVVNMVFKPDWWTGPVDIWVEDDGDGSEDALVSIEKLVGSQHDDRVLWAASTEFDGGDGDDTLSALFLEAPLAYDGSAERLEAGDAVIDFANIDILEGSAFGDTLRAHADFKTLQGGFGNDVLYASVCVGQPHFVIFQDQDDAFDQIVFEGLNRGDVTVTYEGAKIYDHADEDAIGVFNLGITINSTGFVVPSPRTGRWGSPLPVLGGVNGPIAHRPSRPQVAICDTRSVGQPSSDYQGRVQVGELGMIKVNSTSGAGMY